MGCVEVPGGESAEQLKALGFVLKKVAMPTTPPDGTDKKTKKLLAQGKKLKSQRLGSAMQSSANTQGDSPADRRETGQPC